MLMAVSIVSDMDERTLGADKSKFLMRLRMQKSGILR
jgi:hypothetical protein